MKRTFNLVSLFTITLITALLFSCNEQNLIENQITNENNNSKSLQKEIKPKALPCDTKIVRRWETSEDESFYFPVVGKKLGFNKKGFATISEMKEKYGFSKVMGSSKSSAIAAGFSTSDIVGTVNISKLKYTIGFDSYYIDEPIEYGIEHNIDNMHNLVITLASKLYPKKLIMGSYKISTLDWSGAETAYSIILEASSNAKIMSDNYYGFYVDWPFEITSNQDQRGYWNDFQDAYSNRNKSNWISLIIDAKASRGDGDFHDLLGWANSRGFREMWLYIGNADSDHPETLTQSKFDRDIKKFVQAAHQQGWLKHNLVQIEYTYVYECKLQNPCNCDQEDELSVGWKLIRKYQSGKRTIIY